MAVTITKTPPALIGIGDVICFCIQSTSIDNKKTWYKLTCVDSGKTLIEQSYFDPCEEGETVCIDVKSAIAKNLYSVPPSIDFIPLVAGSTATYNGDTGKKEILFEYGEVVLSEDCDTPAQVNSLGSISGIIVVNYALQIDQLDFFEASTITKLLLSSRPKKYTVFCDAAEWLYFYGPYSLTQTFYYHDGTNETRSLSAPNTDAISIVPIGFISDPFPNRGLKHVRVDADGYEFLIMVDPSCCESTDIYFKSPYGGYDTMSVSCPDQETIERNYNEICRQHDCSLPLVDRRRNSKLITNVKSKEPLFFTKTIKNTKDSKRWLSHFAGSERHYIKIKDQLGNLQIVPFTLNSGSFVTMVKDGKLEFGFTGSFRGVNTQGNTI